MHPIYLYTLYFANRITIFLHATMEHLYQMFRTYFIYSQALFDSVDIASPLGSDSSHPGHGTKCSRRRNRPLNKNFQSRQTSSWVPRLGFEPMASGFLIGRHNLWTSWTGQLCTLYIYIYSPCNFWPRTPLSSEESFLSNVPLCKCL